MGRNRHQIRQLLFAWLPSAIGTLVISLESSDYLSAARTGSLLARFCVWLGCGPHTNLMLENHILRKSGHFSGYGILRLLFYRAWRLSGHILSVHRARILDVVFSLACTLAVSSADEYHQSFLPSRTGRPQDVILDMTGAVVFLLLFQLWLILKHHREPALAD